MAEEEQQVVRLRSEFYRDGFKTVLIALVLVFLAIAALLALSIHLFLSKPAPLYFKTDNEWRVLAPVPLNQAYLSDADLLQWVGQALTASFSYDFLKYKAEQQGNLQYYTSKGWDNLLGQLNNYHEDYNSLQTSRQFVTAQLSGAPFILNKGVLPEGKYAWKVQIPMNLSYSSGIKHSLVIIALVVRIPTLNYLYGVGIDDMKITESQQNVVKTNA